MTDIDHGPRDAEPPEDDDQEQLLPAVPDMPDRFADRAEDLFEDGRLSIDEAYWQAACETLGIRRPPVKLTGIHIDLTPARKWRVRWREDGTARQATFDRRHIAEDHVRSLYRTSHRL